MKKSYTFEEILLALRDEYIKNQLLLKKLNEFYVVYGKKVEDYKICPKFQYTSIDGRIYDKLLYLQVQEKVNKLWKTIVKLLNSDAHVYTYIFYDINNRYSKDYSFIKNGKDRVDLSSKQLTINVTKPLEFDNLVDEILNSEFMSLNKKDCGSMFGGYSLDIDGGQFFCGKRGENVLYDAHEDVVQFRGFDCQSAAKEFIRQPIPDTYLYDDIKKLIDRNIKPNHEIKIDEYNFSKVTRLDVREDDNGLRLVKTRKR